jgi:hypothetical protein
MSEDLYVRVMDKNTLSIVFRGAFLRIEAGGDTFVKFRVVGLGGEGRCVQVQMDEFSNKRNKEDVKAVIFTIK